MAHPQIAVFARLANGGSAPNRVIAGQATKLSRTMHDIRYNSVRDEIVVSNPFAQAVLTFPGDANGDAPPLRYIQGPHTNLHTPDVLDIDTVHNEIFVPDVSGVLVFPIEGSGDVAPLRQLKYKSGLGEGSVTVDPVHNVLVEAGGVMLNGKRNAALLLFDRTANGDDQPKRIIAGPKTGLIGTRQLALYPPKGWIVVTQITSGEEPEPEGTFVGIWSVNDSGDVPPKWKIEGKAANVMKKPRGVTLDPKHKEVIVSDMRLNAVLTYYFPEMYQ